MSRRRRKRRGRGDGYEGGIWELICGRMGELERVKVKAKDG